MTDQGAPSIEAGLVSIWGTLRNMWRQATAHMTALEQVASKLMGWILRLERGSGGGSRHHGIVLTDIDANW